MVAALEVGTADEEGATGGPIFGFGQRVRPGVNG